MDRDAEFMQRAVGLAARGLGRTRPNPAVGALIVKGGKIIGEGWHRKAGGDQERGKARCKDSQWRNDLRDT